MYELVKRILDKSKETGEDVLVARDMCIAEDKPNEAELRKAGEFIGAHYDVITKCRREKDEASIEKLCDLVANGTPDDIRTFKAEVLER
ncbi:MAG: hypothetical protein IJC10_00145 [Clostridia bacterium]|nr:hypothetical protein [Clostridia bacterium]